MNVNLAISKVGEVPFYKKEQPSIQPKFQVSIFETTSSCKSVCNSLEGRISANNVIIENMISDLMYASTDFSGRHEETPLLLENWIAKYRVELTSNLYISKIQAIELYALLYRAKGLCHLINTPPSIENHNSIVMIKMVADFIYHSDSLTDFRNKLQNIMELSEKEIRALTAIYINIWQFTIEEVISEISLEKCLELSHIRYIELHGINDVDICTKILERNPYVNILQVYCNRNIQGIHSSLFKCKALICSNCPELKFLPDALPNCEVLDCSYCPKLERLPTSLPNCRVVHCHYCPELQLLPTELSKCKVFNCRCSPQITFLPILPNCEEIDCTGCLQLQYLPTSLLNCKMLHFYGCFLLNGQLPKLPINAEIFTNESDFKSYAEISIEFNEVSNNSKKIVLSLRRNNWLNDRPFPHEYYYESKVIGMGKLRRDLASKSLDCFLPNHDPSHYLVKDKLLNGTEQTIQQAKCKATGSFLALCFSEDSFFKAGPFLSEKAYKAITSMYNPAKKKALISTYLILAEASKNVKNFIEGADIVLNTEDLFFLSNIMDESGETQLDQNSVNDTQIRIALKNRIVKKAKEMKDVRQLVWIAQKMRKNLGQDSWKLICKLGWVALKERIEGKLPRELLINSLKLVHTNKEDENTNSTQIFFEHWIHNAKSKELAQFVRALTTDNTLGPDKIELKLYESENGHLPMSHTCFFTLDLPTSYSDQDQFNNKMNEFLTKVGDYVKPET